MPSKVVIYTDYPYYEDGTGVFSERAFTLFIGQLADSVDTLVVVGRLHPRAGQSRYRLPAHAQFVGLPFYDSLRHPTRAAAPLMRSISVFRRAVQGADAVWLLGPHPLAVVLAADALLRKQRVVLGVRQDLITYTRRRYPSRLDMRLAASSLEHAYRLLARLCPTITVGQDLANQYRYAADLLAMNVSLVPQDALVELEAASKPVTSPRRLLTVGRLDPEKNPLLLAEILKRLQDAGGDYRLTVCGEGPLLPALRARIVDLGIEDRVELRGYVAFGPELWTLYRDSDALLHTSDTEGFPQVMLEAMASGLPVVTTAVGGIPSVMAGRSLLYSPGDAGAAARHLERLFEDEQLRTALIAAGLEYAAAHTSDKETARVASFLLDGALVDQPALSAAV